MTQNGSKTLKNMLKHVFETFGVVLSGFEVIWKFSKPGPNLKTHKFLIWFGVGGTVVYFGGWTAGKSKMPKFGLFGHRSYTSREPTDLSPRHFTPTMGTKKTPEMGSVAHREVSLPGLPRLPRGGPLRGAASGPQKPQPIQKWTYYNFWSKMPKMLKITNISPKMPQKCENDVLIALYGEIWARTLPSPQDGGFLAVSF